MDIISAARTINTQDWDLTTKETMLAIAAAESHLNETAQGDPLHNYKGYWHQLYAPYACEGYLAFGIFQIFTYWHAQKLRDATGSDQPCDWRQWLWDPSNNTAMASVILANQGFSAWSVYNHNLHLDWLPEAQSALRAIHHVEPEPTPPPPLDIYRTIPATLRHLADLLDEHFRTSPPF